MNEEDDIVTALLGGIQLQDSMNGDASLPDDTADEEVKAIISNLQSLHFKDEDQKTSLLENVQRLQDYHVVQIFKFGVARLRTYGTENSEFVEEVIKLFDICFSFCYTPDVTKRVVFDYFVKALKFCFPPPPKECLTTTVISMLLQLVQVLQGGQIAEIVGEKTQQGVNPQMHIGGTKHFTDELLAIFEKRRDEGCIQEIVSQTLRFASADVSVSCIQEHDVGILRFCSEHMVSPVFLRNWMKLLTFSDVSNGFAATLAKVDALRVTKNSTPLRSPILPGITIETSNLIYDSIVFQFVGTLEQVKRMEVNVTLPSDGTERWDIFFKHINHFYKNPNMIVTFLMLFTSISISNKVLEQIVEKFFCREKRPSQHSQYSPSEADTKGKAFHQLFQVLSVLPDGSLVNKVLDLWAETFPVDIDYRNLELLMALLGRGLPCESRPCLEERAERTFKFLTWIPPTLLPFVQHWFPVLSCFITMFPGTFHKRPEVLCFIHKTQEEAKVAAIKRQGFFTAEGILGTPQFFQFLYWIARQYLSDDVRNEMVWLLMCHTDGASYGQNWEFSRIVIIQLSLCQQLSFSRKQGIFHELSNLAKHFKGQNERSVFLKIIGGLRSLGSREFIDEILCESFDFINRFVVKDRPMKTIPSNVLQLLTLVSTVPISGDRRVKILKNSKASGKGLSSSIHILELLKLHCVAEEANEYFDFLYCIFVDILKDHKELCGKVCEELRQIPVSSQKEWIHEVAKSLSQGSFSAEVDLHCLNVLGQAHGLSEVEMLQLFFHLRGSAQEIIKENEIQSFHNAPSSSIPAALVSSLIHVVGSIKLYGEEKLVLVSEVCGLFLQRSTVVSEKNIENALCHLIPYAHSHSSSSPNNENDVHLDSKQIVVILKDPVVMAQLSRIPADTEKSLCAVLSQINYDSFSKERLAEMYSFIGAQKDLDDDFFTHFLSVLEVIIQESKSTEDVMEILQEMVCLIRAVPSGLIPLIMLSFQYLLENRVSKQERERFLKEVVMKWDGPPDISVLCYLKVSHLLWKTYCNIDCQAKRCELANRVQEILESTNEEVKSYCKMGLELWHGDTIRRILCCELEWLVFHSPLSNDEATLAYNLCFRSFIPQLKIRCFAVADLPAVCIEEGRLTTVPKETTLGKDSIVTPWTAVTSNESDCQGLESRTLGLTPIYVAQRMIQRLRPILGPEENLSEIAFLLWDTVFSSPQTGCGAECATSSYFLDEFMEVFLTILAVVSSTDVLRYWTEQNKHHVFQCSDVILKACKKTSESEDMDKEARLNFHAAVYKTLEVVRERTPATSALFFGVVVAQPASCFRIVKPQLNHLCNMLGGSLSIKVTLAVLDLFQVSVQAGVAVGEIVSSWTSEEQTLQLIKSVKMRCQEEEMSALHNAAQNEFVWQLAKAFGRLFVNSCEDVLAKIEQLVVLFDQDDVYGLNRLPGWRVKIVVEGFPSHPVDCWCIAFLATPLEDLSSRDVDAIVELNADSLQLVESVAKSIKSCIFPEHGFEVSLDKGIKETQTKERLRLARLLGEFINVLKVGKSEENQKAAVIKEIVVDACNELCKARVEQKRRNELYKIHGQKLKALFTEVFGKQHKPEMGLTHETRVEGSTAVSSFARQTSYLHENLPRVLSCNAVYEPLLLLLRRWLSGIVRKRDLAACTKEIVQLLFSAQFSDEGSVRLNELHDSIGSRILSLENNKALMAQLQAAGYNQKDQGSRDLWSLPSVECPGYLSKRESPDERRYRKKLVGVLRCVWNEWKGILYVLGKVSIKVGETDVCTKDLFGLQASLEEIEEQVSAVKKTVSQFKSDEIETRVKQLMRQEQRHRAKIKRRYMSNKVKMAYL